MAKLNGKHIGDIVGTMKDYAGSSTPVNYLLCDGSNYNAVANPQYQNLFNVIGTTYGGTGITLFQVPDSRGRTHIGTGTGSGLTPRALGIAPGAESIQLSINQMPSHHHFSPNTYRSTDTSNNTYPGGLTNGFQPVSYQTTDTGGSLPHDNVQPSLAVTKIIKY